MAIGQLGGTDHSTLLRQEKEVDPRCFASLGSILSLAKIKEVLEPQSGMIYRGIVKRYALHGLSQPMGSA